MFPNVKFYESYFEDVIDDLIDLEIDVDIYYDEKLKMFTPLFLKFNPVCFESLINAPLAELALIIKRCR